MDAELAAGSGNVQKIRTSRKRPFEETAPLRFLMTGRSGPLDRKNQGEMAAGHEPVLGHSASVPAAAPIDVFGRAMTACGHGMNVSCACCGGGY